MAESAKHLLLVEDEVPLRLAVAEQLADRGSGRGLISICTAGGMGVAAILER